MGDGEPLHELGKIAVLTGPEKEMPVVAHYAVTADANINPLSGLRDYTFKGKKVIGLFEYTQTAVGTVDDVVNNAACCFSFRSGHGYIVMSIKKTSSKNQSLF
jgi:hypothetical protein